MQPKFGSLCTPLFLKQMAGCCTAWLNHNKELRNPLEMHLVIRRYCYLSLRKYRAVTSGITHGRLYKTYQLFGIFPFIWYVMNQNRAFMPKDPYYVGGIGVSPKIFNPANYSHLKYSN